jgi:pimeloyl-ACP methyl ester carboxylesterase
MKFPPLFIVFFLSVSFSFAQQKPDLLNKLATLTHKPKPALKPNAVNLENVEYPFPVSYISLTIQNEDLKMAYMDLPSKKPNGDVIMLLHGKNFCAAYWKKTALDLSKAGYRVIMPDQIGFGKSSKPEHLNYSFQLLAQNTKALLDSLNIKDIMVLGHSMGGMLATRFVLMYPDMIKKLILENPIGLEDYKLTVPYQTIDENYKKELKQNYDRIKDYELTNYYGDHWKPEYDEWVNLLAGWTLDPDYPRIAWNAALTTDMIITQPVCYEFERITVPTLLIIGQRDRTALVNAKTPEEIKSKLGNYPELGKLTAKKIANSQLVELDNVGHLPHIEAYPKFIAPLLTFLKSEIKPIDKSETVPVEKTEKESTEKVDAVQMDKGKEKETEKEKDE